MIVGCLGDVVFEVSEEKVLTPKNMQWSSGASWSEHKRHMKSPLLEYTGLEADEFKLPIRLSWFAGVDPMEMITQLFQYERDGTPVPLTLGNHAYGRYKWVIKSTSRELEYTDEAGDLIVAELTLNLKGYVL